MSNIEKNIDLQNEVTRQAGKIREIIKELNSNKTEIFKRIIATCNEVCTKKPVSYEILEPVLAFGRWHDIAEVIFADGTLNLGLRGLDTAGIKLTKDTLTIIQDTESSAMEWEDMVYSTLSVVSMDIWDTNSYDISIKIELSNKPFDICLVKHLDNVLME